MLFYFLIFIFLIGLIIGSFTNCFIWRLYKKESLWGRSYCPKCNEKIHWYDNIPVFSYILLKAKCRNCKKDISIQYPVVEFAIGVLFVISFFLNFRDFISEPLSYYNLFLLIDSSFVLTIARDFFIIFVMVGIFIYDLRWFLIPDKLILPASVLVLSINLFLGVDLVSLVIVGLVGASFFLLQFVISRGAWIGGGDIRLGLFMGLALGRLDYLILALIMAYFLGSIVGIWLILSKKKQWKSQMPLGVFLSTSTVIALFFSREIIDWYFGLF